jgi:hypothetical protein
MTTYAQALAEIKADVIAGVFLNYSVEDGEISVETDQRWCVIFPMRGMGDDIEGGIDNGYGLLSDF